jgi:3-deoxy-manno-octulosonate cytidylyltransferase (CMP-KDO synthetase)
MSVEGAPPRESGQPEGAMVFLSVPARVLGVIPARYQSTRFPGKALATLAGKSILQHVYERAVQARYLSEVLIATDDDRIYAEARKFGAPVRMTRADHPSGTDRVAEAASADSAQVVVNIQGDEPLIDPAAIDAAAIELINDSSLMMGTLKRRIDNPDDITNPNVVKVVTDLSGNAIYFSRNPIPYNRAGGAVYFKHVGLYVYRRNFLLGYSALPVGALEKVECLEQMRALENGYRIRVVETEYESFGVDTPEDLEQAARLFAMADSRG